MGNNGAGIPPSGGGMVPPEMFAELIQSLATISGVSNLPAANSAAGNGANVQPHSGGSSSAYTITAAYEQDGGYVIKDGQTYSAADQDQSAVYVKNGGMLTLSNATITTTGTGANGAFATDSGSTVNLTDVTIQASADGAHAVMATRREYHQYFRDTVECQRRQLGSQRLERR
jgi:hypothetical protein